MRTFVWTARCPRGLGLLSLAAYAWLGVPNANAQEQTARPDARCADGQAPRDPEAARVAFRAGQTAFSEGAYARAVELWDQAYRDDCTAHALLLNLAMGQELMGRPEDAIRTLRLFDSRSPDSPYVEANAKRIQRLQQTALESEQESARTAHARSISAHPASDEAQLSVPLVVSVVGGVVAIVGAALYVEGRASAESAAEQCGAAREVCADVDGVVEGERARARAQVGGWMAGAGLLTAAGGLSWHFLSSSGRPTDQSASSNAVSLVTDVTSGGAGLSWSGRF